jgi:hypothetical protein
MKLTKKILLAVLVLSSLMPLSAAIISLTSQDKLFEMFKMPPVEGAAPLIVVLSACFIAFFIVHATAFVLIWKGKSGGRDIAIMLGWINIISGIALFSGFMRIGFDGNMMAAMDFGKGLLIVGLAYSAKG